MNHIALARCAAVILASATITACAPDAWQNVRATGFNAYLSTVEANCQPLWFGRMRLDRFDPASAGAYQSDYAALLDSASQLYYNRITPAQFREAVNSMTLSTGDTQTNRTVDCMVARLPPDRPSSPAGAR